jgi:hypothetical protein
MKKFEITIAAVSLVITMLISTLFGFAGSFIIGTFWSWFILSFLLQIILFLGLNSFLIQKEMSARQLAEIQTLEQLSKFVVRLTCAYCQHPNNVPIQLNQKNTFTCESCNQANGVYMQFTATSLSTPLEKVTASIENIAKKA